ncbi:hypothetical protein TTHERM_00784730 (macronuclear) [Tetrahymena thermophila SB210]|uniref:Uncharacterized protein n=1 Tax=Tetrahymena thermophila (strain SB210) TaxID=312017 RepID=Q231L6_TETTS|nr:hypothetical protein TTHERM_00784730 [Tetrahymena thermophila SB210]EAR91286.2 hypothetical protein TTHERM_00784730 [Tetrahymena thermophila SB210]|eukprot:XP_001011531.2 hypothetical protein TTHERM_00784730 [Tetrahymena thermophila SB210]
MKKNSFSFKLNINSDLKNSPSFRKDKSADKKIIIDHKNNTSRTTIECDFKTAFEQKGNNANINQGQKQKSIQCLTKRYENKKSIDLKRQDETQFLKKSQVYQSARQMINTQQMSSIKRQKSHTKQSLSISNQNKSANLTQQNESNNNFKSSLLQKYKLTNAHMQSKSSSSPLRVSVQVTQPKQEKLKTIELKRQNTSELKRQKSLELQRQKTLDFQKQCNLSPILKTLEQKSSSKLRNKQNGEETSKSSYSKFYQNFLFNDCYDYEGYQDESDLKHIDLEFNLTDMTASMSELKKQLSYQKEIDYSFSSFTNHSHTTPKEKQRKISNEYDQILGDVYSTESFECEDKSVGNEYNQIEERLDKKLKATQLLTSSSFQNDINIYYSLEDELKKKNLDKSQIEKKLHQEFIRNQLQKNNEMSIASTFLIEYNPKTKTEYNSNRTISIIVLDQINELVSQENLASPILMSSSIKECYVSRRFSQIPSELNLDNIGQQNNKRQKDTANIKVKSSQIKKPLLKLNNQTRQNSVPKVNFLFFIISKNL